MSIFREPYICHRVRRDRNLNICHCTCRIYKLNLLPVKISLTLFDDDDDDDVTQFLDIILRVSLSKPLRFGSRFYFRFQTNRIRKKKRTKLGPTVETLSNHGYYSLSLSVFLDLLFLFFVLNFIVI
jgi:hypothetical protein